MSQKKERKNLYYTCDVINLSMERKNTHPELV